MKKGIKLTTIILAFFSISSCYKAEKHNQNGAAVNTILKEYFGSFKNGSTWNFIANNGLTETVSVKQYRDIDPNIAVVLTSSKGLETLVNTSFNQTFVRYYSNAISFEGHKIRVDENINEIEVTDDPKETRVRLEMIDEMIVNGNVYTDVIHSIDMNDPYFQEYYIAKDIGIIRKVAVLKDQVTYDLVNFIIAK